MKIRLPKIIGATRFEIIALLVDDIEEINFLIKKVLDGFKDGIGPDDIKKCSVLADRLDSVTRTLKDIV